MAIAFRSYNTGGSRAANPLLVTKPTGLTAGDLMIAYCVCNNTTGFSTPSGWTAVVNRNGITRSYDVFAKVADSGDAAASNFSFTGSGSGSDGHLVLLCAFSGTFTSTLSVNKSVYNDTDLTTTGVDPDLGGALVMFGAINGASTAGGVFSNYSVVTDNPSWTEIDDGRYNDLTEIHYFGAWGTRASSAATGNSSVSESAGGTNFGGVLLALVEATGANGNHTILVADSTIPDSNLSVGTTASHDILVAESTIADSSAQITQGADQWQLDTKNTGSWTLDNKS